MQFKLADFFHGLKKGSPIALGYIPIAIAFGILARSAEITPHAIILMSALVFAGASQFIAVNLLLSGVGPWQIIITTFIVNSRHFLMSSYLAQRLSDKIPAKLMPIISFGVTDETFSLASLTASRDLTTGFISGLNLIAYLAWVSGTALGVFIEQGLPKIVQSSLGIALYAMFIGLLIPNFKESKGIVIISLVAMILNSILNWGPGLLKLIPQGWQLIIAAIIASCLGAYLFPKEVTDIE